MSEWGTTEYFREWRANHPGYAKNRYQADPEKFRAQARAAYYRNREKRKASSMEYYFSHHEEQKQKRRDYYKEHKQESRSDSFLKLYGITLEQRDQIIASQNGLCAVCPDMLDLEYQKRVHIDHDHATGKIRGILCSNCNLALGHAKDSVDRLNMLIAYLERHK